MLIEQLILKNFRCFKNYSLDFSSTISCITGPNGSGKSSILEALHYACYLRSFRTHVPRDLVNFDDENFFIKVKINEPVGAISLSHELTMGFSKKKRIVKIDQKSVTSYKDISKLYRVVTLTEDDLSLIKGSPDGRRLFLDQALALEFPEFLMQSKHYKKILENRNALLYRGGYTHESYCLWTEQLWQETIIIQNYRIRMLKKLEQATNDMLMTLFGEGLTLVFDYHAKKTDDPQSFEDFLHCNCALQSEESMLRRSLFGAHLDDFSIEFCHKSSRSFASRGQQKLIIMLIKIAQIQEITAKHGHVVFLLDDFMTDFDYQKGKILLSLMRTLNCQLIVTSPTNSDYFDTILGHRDVQHINLDVTP